MYTKDEQEECLYRVKELMTSCYTNYSDALVLENENYVFVQKGDNIYVETGFWYLDGCLHLGVKVIVPYSLGSVPIENNWSYSSESGDEHSYMKLCRLTANTDVLVKFEEFAVESVDIVVR